MLLWWIDMDWLVGLPAREIQRYLHRYTVHMVICVLQQMFWLRIQPDESQIFMQYTI